MSLKNTGHLIEDLASAAPAGIDVYFENVGGEILEAVLERLNIFARIPLCGFISQYTTGPYESRNLGTLIVNRVKLQGFVGTMDGRAFRVESGSRARLRHRPGCRYIHS